MIFVTGIPTRHHADVIKSLVKALPSEQITGLPASERPAFSKGYAEECLDTIVAYRQGRPNCFDRGLAVIALRQPGENIEKFRSTFFPFALFDIANFERRYSISPAQSRRDKNEISRIVLGAAKRLNKNTLIVSEYLQSRSGRTPFLLPIRHFDEIPLREAIEKAWEVVPKERNPLDTLNKLSATFERSFPFVKKGRAATGRFTNSKNVWFTMPGRDLHGVPGPSKGHLLECLLNGELRIGGPIRRGFHYDCTKQGAKYGGVFADCHDESVSRSGNPHLNVYPNDYIR